MRSALHLVLLLLALSSSLAASKDSLRLDVRDTDLTTFPEISFRIAVLGEKNMPVPRLTPAAFGLVESGKPASILALEPDRSPSTVVLLLDSSEGAGPSMALLKAGAAAFVRQLGDKDRVVLVSFDDHPRFLADGDQPRGTALAAIDSLTATGGRCVFDALQLGLKRMGDPDRRRFVILVTHGADRNEEGTAAQSSASPKEVVQIAREARAALFVLGLDSRIDNTIFQKVALATGGQSYLLKGAGQLARALEKVKAIATHGYRLRCRSPLETRDRTSRKLAITVKSGTLSGKAELSYQAPGESPAPDASAGSEDAPEEIRGIILGPGVEDEAYAECVALNEVSDSIPSGSSEEALPEWELSVTGCTESPVDHTSHAPDHIIETRVRNAKFVQVDIEAKAPRGGVQLGVGKYVLLKTDGGRYWRGEDWLTAVGVSETEWEQGKTTASGTMKFLIDAEAVPEALLYSDQKQEIALSASSGVFETRPLQPGGGDHTLPGDPPYRMSVQKMEYLGAVRYWRTTYTGTGQFHQGKKGNCENWTHRPYPGMRFLGLTVEITLTNTDPEASVQGMRLERFTAERTLYPPVVELELDAQGNPVLPEPSRPDSGISWLKTGTRGLIVFSIEEGLKKLELLAHQHPLLSIDIPADLEGPTRSTTATK